tara:strand:- start:556 stop:1839 length:1284 start_codon:yes stop_codon:yes gene_type:complete
MADVPINAVTRRVQFDNNTGTGPFAFTFEILQAADIAVFKNDTLLTEGGGADYTVTIAANGTGSVTLTGSNNGTALIATDLLTLIGGRALARTTDFVTAGDLLASSLNEQLDSLVIMTQQLDEKIERSLRIDQSDKTASMSVPNLATRKGKYLAFNSTTGLPEAGAASDDVTTIAAITTDIATLADIEDGTDATDAIQTVAGISGNVTTVAGVSAAVSTNATNIASINTNAANITDIQNAEEHAQEAKDYATKVNGQVQENGSDSGNYASKAWAIGGTGVTDTAGSGAAKEWATETGSNVDGTEWSAKEYAIGSQAGNTSGSAKQWALGGGGSYASNTTVDGSNYSARYWAEQAAAAVDGFDDTYLGPKSSDPTVDNDGDALTAGDLYFSTASNVMKVYNGSAWNEVAADTSGFATNGFSIAMGIAL